MLQIDFYESGDGETIVVTFPGGGMGIVDAHPSPGSARPALGEIIRDRELHFVCLTHPHRDHGVDLVDVLRRHPKVNAFWHTVSDVAVLVFLEQGVIHYPNYPSPCREVVNRLQEGWARFLIDLYAAVEERRIPRHQLRSDLRAVTVDGVEIHCLSPEEGIVQRFGRAHGRKLKDVGVDVPDKNLLSAVLALRYGGVVVLLGADALKENWQNATKLYFKLKLPKARILKIPHHGASNALSIRPKGHEHSYLDLCSREPPASSVLFAGDSKHPNPGVFEAIRARTEVTCVSNGLRIGSGDANPLRIGILGARTTLPPVMCNPRVSFKILPDGEVRQTAGTRCSECPACI